MSATLTERPANRTENGRRGQYEMVVYTTWTRRQTGYVRAKGQYDVYCGAGNMHRESLDEIGLADEMLRLLDAQGCEPTVSEAGEELVSQWLAWEWQGCDCDTI